MTETRMKNVLDRLIIYPGKEGGVIFCFYFSYYMISKRRNRKAKYIMHIDNNFLNIAITMTMVPAFFKKFPHR